MSNMLINLMTCESLEGQAVNARELYNFLEIKTHLSTWFKRMVDYGFEEGKDFVHVSKNENMKASKWNPDNYAITLDMAKEISMIQRSEKGKQAREYFIACEKKLKEVVKPKTRLELAKENLSLIEEIEEKDALLLETTPKAEKYDTFMDSTGLQTATQVGQLFGLSAFALNKILTEKGVYNPQVKRTKVFSIMFVKNGFGKTIESERGFSQSMFTATGIDFVAGLLKDKNINPIGKI